jgi:hypothetical protein
MPIVRLGTLPTVCDPTKQTNPYCFGAFMFVVKRVQTK